MKPFRIILQLLKADHWIKNLYLFAPLFFSGQFLQTDKLISVAKGFVVFCFASSCIYIINDLIDAENDRQHPQKKNRPIAAGTVSQKNAVLIIFLLLFLLAGSSIWFPGKFLIILGAYTVLNVFYSIWLKQFTIIDISVISFGFVLRVVAGGVLCAVPVSHWLIIMIYLLSMFLALAKRRDDIVLIEKNEAGASIRKVAKGYSLEFTQTGLVCMATIMIVCYIMYITSPEIMERLHFRYAYFNTFFVVAGVLKYLQIIFVDNKAGSPVKIMLGNRFIQACVLLWLLSFAILIYRHH